MNGEVLSRDRGYPLRVIVPGHIGARSVKWLRRITVQKEEAPHFHQQRDYKLFPPSIDWSNVEPLWAKMPSMQEINVQSAICDPCISRHTFFFSIKKKKFCMNNSGRRKRWQGTLQNTWVCAVWWRSPYRPRRLEL